MKQKTNSILKRKKLLKTKGRSTARASVAGKRNLRKKTSVAARTRRGIAKTSAKGNLHSAQQIVSETKFYTGVEHRGRFAQAFPAELPQRYQEDKIVIQARDPWWVHAYWEVQPSTVEKIKQNFGDDFIGAKSVLRIYDVSYVVFNGNNAHRYFDIEITFEASNWYIDTGGPGRGWCIDIGFRLRDGRFIMIARSNCITLPLDGPSWETDEEWLLPEDLFARLYGMSFGLGPNSPVGKVSKISKGLRERMKIHIGSPGLFSVSSPVRPRLKEIKEKEFWLVVKTELIVYGATKPDAKLTVCGKPIKLKSDGTFSLRFALPDGKQTIPVEAVSADGDDSRTITPVVTKETH